MRDSPNVVPLFIAALTTRLADEAIAATLVAFSSAGPPEEAVRAGISAFVVHLADDSRRARVLFGAMPAGDAVAGHRAAAIGRLIGTVEARACSLLTLTPGPFVEVSAAMLVGGASQAVLDWLDGRFKTFREVLVGDLVALWLLISDGAAARLTSFSSSPRLSPARSGRASRRP